MTGRLRSWWALDTGEKMELLVVVALAVAAEVAVKVASLPRLARILGIALVDQSPGEWPDAPATMDAATIERRARMVDRVYRHWPRKSSCLRRALVLGFRIRAAHPTLLIGVARDNDEIRAHAWIEVQGKVVGSESGDWAPLRSHESAG